MILGKITGKVSTTNFQFLIQGDAKKFQYVQALQKDGVYVLAQIIEIYTDMQESIAHCNVIGYRDNEHVLRALTVPLEPATEILKAEDSFIEHTLGLATEENHAYLGLLDGRNNIKVHLDLNKLLTKHVAIIAKSGSGKSYSSGILIEEILEKNIPLIIIDPHGEYISLRQPNDNDREKALMHKFDVKPKSYQDKIQEFSPDIEVNKEAKPLKLSAKDLTPLELITLLPAKLSNMQTAVLYSALKGLEHIDINALIYHLEAEESNAKWTLINVLEYVNKLGIFSETPTMMNELVQPGKASIINLKGTSHEVQEVIVYKLLTTLFQERKKENIPPFFLVIEEAHLFIPERTFGEAKSSAIIRQICAEGRKFGLGVCLITQRPSRIEKNALSQITTQIILKVTNPHDIRAISGSVEGLTTETEKEIRNLPIGTAMVFGIVDVPLFVDIRPRKTKHGGQAVYMVTKPEPEKTFIEHTAEHAATFQKTVELLPVIKQHIELKDLRFIYGAKKITTQLVPVLLLMFDDYNILLNLHNSHIVDNLEDASGTKLKALSIKYISEEEQRLVRLGVELNTFTSSELFARLGLQFSQLYNAITNLVGRGIFLKHDDGYKINEQLAFFSKLRRFAIFEKPQHATIEYDEKLEVNYDKSKIISFFTNLLGLRDYKECWLVRYDVSE